LILHQKVLNFDFQKIMKKELIKKKKN
jgi:hypothetical protein